MKLQQVAHRRSSQNGKYGRANGGLLTAEKRTTKLLMFEYWDT